MLRFLNDLFTIGFSLVDEVFSTTADGIVEAVPSKQKIVYDAHFGEPANILFPPGTGFHIGKWSTGNDVFSILIVGSSGSHKTTSCLFPQLLQDHSCSYIIYDPSKEMLTNCGPTLRNAGIDVLVFDPDNPETSACFNGLAQCTDDASIYRFVNALIRNSIEDAPIDYWVQSAEALLVFACTYILRYTEPEFRHVTSVLQLLRLFMYDGQKLDERIVRTGNKALLMQYKAFVATPEKTLHSSISTAISYLRMYDSSNIAAVTSYSTIDPLSFRAKKHALFICSGASRAQTYRPIIANIFDSFFASILDSKPTNKSTCITFLLDESANLFLCLLPQFLALTRKHNAKVATFWQDLGQIQHLYSKKLADSILANSQIHVFMPQSSFSLETCKMLETICGKFEFIDDDGKMRIRELLTVSEIRQLKKILVLYKGKPPLLIDNQPFYKQPRLRKLVERSKTTPLPSLQSAPSKIPIHDGSKNI